MRPFIATVWDSPVWIVSILVLSLIGVPLLATAQRSGVRYWIDFLVFGHPTSEMVTVSPLTVFWQALHELGYAEERTLVIDERWGEARLNQLHVFANELEQLRPDVIIASGASEVRVARRTTQQIPIVIAGDDSGEEGLVSPSSHPDCPPETYPERPP